MKLVVVFSLVLALSAASAPLTFSQNDHQSSLYDDIVEEIRSLKDQINQQNRRIEEQRLEISSLKVQVNSKNKTTRPVDPSPAQALDLMPESCADLRMNGHQLSGIYSIKGSQQIETVYCNMSQHPSDDGFQQLIGYADVKSSNVYFYVQKEKKFATVKGAVPFDIERVNIGGAMDLQSGVFTAPVAGQYFFAFSGINEGSSSTYVELQRNNDMVGTAYGTDVGFNTFALNTMLNLQSGDKIKLVLRLGDVYDSSFYHFTHFVGWLIRQQLF